MIFEMIPTTQDNLEKVENKKRYFVTNHIKQVEINADCGQTVPGQDVHGWDYFCPEPIEFVQKEPEFLPEEGAVYDFQNHYGYTNTVYCKDGQLFRIGRDERVELEEIKRIWKVSDKLIELNKG